jgi:hypothetical protein
MNQKRAQLALIFISLKFPKILKLVPGVILIPSTKTLPVPVFKNTIEFAKDTMI